MKLYEEQRERLKSTEANAIRTRLLKILKGNTIQNIGELNYAVLDILKVDEFYRKQFFDKFEIQFEGGNPP